VFTMLWTLTGKEFGVLFSCIPIEKSPRFLSLSRHLDITVLDEHRAVVLRQSGLTGPRVRYFWIAQIDVVRMEQCEIRGNGNSQSPDSALLHSRLPCCTNGTSRMGRAPMPIIHYDMGFTSCSAHPTLAMVNTSS